MSCANGSTVVSKAQLAYVYFSHIPRNDIVNTLMFIGPSIIVIVEE